MSIVTYIRSSMVGTHETCSMRLFGEYILGLGNHDFFEQSESVKTTIGTMSHKVFECLGNIKLALDKDECHIIDDHLGKISFIPETVLKKYKLTDKEVDKINKGRKNKEIYRNQNSCKIQYGHKRYGVELVEKLIKKSYDYYSVQIPQDWKPSHFRDLTNFVWMCLDYEVNKNRLYDPRNCKVLAVEPGFDFELKEDWAKYSYDYKGEKLEGYLSLKGTIDLVTELDKDTIEVRDYKTGLRQIFHLDENNIKTYEKLETDTQLLLYNYAIRQMFPQYKNVITTIFFIRDGGPFSIPMDNDECVKLIKERLKTKFNEIRYNVPEQRDPYHNDFRCKYMCPLYKNSFPKAPQVNCCTYLKKYIDKHGTMNAIKHLTGPGHHVDKYKSPGET